jgi:predicted phage-related endonuclease
MFKIHEHEQGTLEWFQARLGKVTGSIAPKIITRTGKPSSSVDEIVNRAVAEIIMQQPDETFQSESMLRGKELEDQALEYFNFVYGYNFEKCGFMEAIDSEGNPLGFGVSPDGVDLKLKIGLELKCPEPHTHLAYLASKELPDKYFQQVQAGLMVSGFDRWVFGSYHPSLPCFRVEVARDETYIKSMRELFNSASKMIKERHLVVSQMVEAS